MDYSTADVDRIARLTAATKAARKLVQQAKAEGHAANTSRQNDRPAASTVNGSSALTVYEGPIRRPDLYG